MAIYHLNLSHGSRGGGQSAGAKLDYISREGKYVDQPDRCLSVGSHVPSEYEGDARSFWLDADKHERANARLFSQIEFALPVELPLDKQEQAVRDLIKKMIPEQPYTFAIHDGKGTNPHCHLIYSERKIDGIERKKGTFFKRGNSKNPERGGASKNRDLKEKKFLQELRSSWGEVANAALRENHSGLSLKKAPQIDHRTLKAQGIDREPQRHIGPQLTAKIERELTQDDKQKSSPSDARRRARELAEEISRSRAESRRSASRARQEARRRAEDSQREQGEVLGRLQEESRRHVRSIQRIDQESKARSEQEHRSLANRHQQDRERIRAVERNAEKGIQPSVERPSERPQNYQRLREFIGRIKHFSEQVHRAVNPHLDKLKGIIAGLHPTSYGVKSVERSIKKPKRVRPMKEYDPAKSGLKSLLKLFDDKQQDREMKRLEEAQKRIDERNARWERESQQRTNLGFGR